MREFDPHWSLHPYNPVRSDTMPESPKSNQDRYDALCEKFGGDSQIPNEALYNFLCEVRADLINIAKLGVSHIPEFRLGLRS